MNVKKFLFDGCSVLTLTCALGNMIVSKHGEHPHIHIEPYSLNFVSMDNAHTVLASTENVSAWLLSKSIKR